MLATERGAGLSYEQQMDGSLPPHFLLQLLMPGCTGGDHRLQVLFSDFRIYAGLLTLPLATVGLLRGPGRHRLRFEYRPRSFQRGLWVSAATLLGLLCGGVFTILRRRR